MPIPNTKIIERDPLKHIIPDIDEYNQRLAQTAYEYVRDAVIRGMQIGAAEVSVVPGFDVTNPEVSKFLQQYVGLMANTVNRAMVEKIRGVLTSGLEQGQSFREMRPAILEALGCARDENGKIVADKGAKYKADLIARTETDRAQNAGRQAQLQEAGAKAKVWRAAPGACEFCAALDGMTVGVEENFFQRGDSISLEREDSTEDSPSASTLHLDYSDTPYPPLHPNCLCITEYEF